MMKHAYLGDVVFLRHLLLNRLWNLVLLRQEVLKTKKPFLCIIKICQKKQVCMPGW